MQGLFDGLRPERAAGARRGRGHERLRRASRPTWSRSSVRSARSRAPDRPSRALLGLPQPCSQPSRWLRASGRRSARTSAWRAITCRSTLIARSGTTRSSARRSDSTASRRAVRRRRRARRSASIGRRRRPPIGARSSWSGSARRSRWIRLVFETGPAEVHAVGIVSGSGSSSIAEAVSMGLDALITGEPSEHAMADAREGGSISSRPGTTPPRRSACAGWGSSWLSASASRTNSSTCQIRFDTVRLKVETRYYARTARLIHPHP